MKKNDARRTALKILTSVRRFSDFSDEALSSRLKALKKVDRALCSKLVYGVLQNRMLLDYYISIHLDRSISRLEPKLLDLFRLSAYQILFLDRIPDRAAISEAVDVTKEINKKASGLVNAVLRRISENKSLVLPENEFEETEYLSIKYSHPKWFCEYMTNKYGRNFTEGFLKANNEEPPIYLQVNTELISAEELLEKILELGLNAEPDSDLKSIKLEQIGELLESDLFHKGYFFIQDKAARAVVDIAQVKSGESILDLCAAPGGKSFASALEMKNSGRVLSCDISQSRLEKLEESAERLKLSVIETKLMDALDAGNLKESFDLVIADVPCSGFGVIRKKPEIRYKNWESLSELADIQKKILNSAANMVNDSGRLIYSTCTIFNEENEEIVADFLARNKNYYIEEEKKFWPHIDGSDGFYICLLKKRT